VFRSSKEVGGDTVCELREGHLDENVIKLGIGDTVMHVAPGASYRGVRHPEGLNGEQFLAFFPAEHVPANQIAAVNVANTRYKREYDQRAGRCIGAIMEMTTDNTRRYFEHEPECKRAINDRDLVAFVQFLKMKGLVGTGDKEEACTALEVQIASKHESTLLKDVNGMCDYSVFAMRWMDIDESLTRAGSRMTEGTKVKAFINALPSEYNTHKGMILLNPPANLPAAINFFRDMIIKQNVQLDDCGELFGVRKISKSKSVLFGNEKRSRESGDEEHQEQTSKPRRDIEDFEKLEKQVTLLRAEVNGMNNTPNGDERHPKYDRGGGGGAGRSRDGRGRGRDNRDLFNRDCVAYKTKGFCDYESRNGTACRLLHAGTRTIHNGIVRPLKKKEEGSAKK